LLRFGLIVNPRAGIGGQVALKGSDDVYDQALALGSEPRAPGRTLRALHAVGKELAACCWFSWGGDMGERYLRALGVEPEVLGSVNGVPQASDTRAAVTALLAQDLDLLVFAGGDGTARDIFDALHRDVPVLGIPAGVKMHSGVFATTPERAGELLRSLITGGMVQSVLRDVRDLDERALRDGRLEPRFFGEMRVPEPGGYLQHTKVSGRENEALAVQEIVADVTERIAQQSRPVILGPGSTLLAVKTALGMQGNLLGIDVWYQDHQQGSDVDRHWLDSQLEAPLVVLSFTRSQGFLLGRGNQQLSPELLRSLAPEDLWVVATRTKLASLEGRPLLVDTDDPDLDRSLTGLIEITTGYEDRILYRVDSHA
jgi:predicted polyphosphate/ATP-dependent NAD kinase